MNFEELSEVFKLMELTEKVELACFSTPSCISLSRLGSATPATSKSQQPETQQFLSHSQSHCDLETDPGHLISWLLILSCLHFLTPSHLCII